MRFFNRSIFGLFLTVLTIGVLLAAVYVFKNAQDDREDRKRPRTDRERSFSVYVLPIKIEAIKPEVTVFGEVLSGRTLELRTSAGGKLVQMSENFRKGGAVTKGELLFTTDPSSANANVQLAETTLMEAKAELSEAQDALILSNDELRAAKHQYELRIQAAKRQKSLLKRGVGTEAAVETAELSASSAETQALSKRQAVANAKARINRAKTSLKRSTINLN
jgi:multidrug efflux pump subunit AcrA (membrane-fusion protein)